MSNASSFLSDSLFSSIIQHTPLISIDLVVRDHNGLVLLGERLNRPAKGYWFVPGGRIRKDERFTQAFDRLVHDELAISYPFKKARFIGPFEHHYSDNVFGHDFSTHYVVLGFELNLSYHPELLPFNQHGDYQWFSVEDILNNQQVHEHTKWYFQTEKNIAQAPSSS